VFWGFVPVYFKAVRYVPALEVLAHRIVWSVPFVAVLVTVAGGWTTTRDLLRSPRKLLFLVGSALLVAVNWLTFITAVSTDRILETSLGYYINPLVSVALGVVFLGERLRRAQVVAIALAAAGTTVLAVGLGHPPWIALTLAVSFGLYGLLRKVVGVGAMTGLLVETSLMLPAAAVYLMVLARNGNASFGPGSPTTSVLLALGGVVTALPLIWFAAAAARLPYSTVGVFQYIAPSLSFLLAVLVYGEPFTGIHAVTFGCIWTALALFVGSGLRRAPHLAA